jgi:hypothetical protein
MSDGISSTPAPSAAPSPAATPAPAAPATNKAGNTTSAVGDVRGHESVRGRESIPGATSVSPDGGAAKDAALAAEAAAKKEAERRRYKLKVDGAELEEELTDDEVTVRLQKARAAEKRMQEAAAQRKQLQEAVEYLKKDPFAAFKESFGVDLDELAERRLAERYREQLMTPEEQERLRLQRENESYKAREAEAQRQREEQARQAYEAKVAEEMERDFMSALEASDLPKTKETLRLMAEVAQLNLDHGIELTPAQMAAEVRERISGIHQHVTRSLKGESLLKYLGDDVVKEVLRQSVARVKGTSATPAPTPNPFGDKTTAPGDDEAPKKPRQMKTMDDWRKAMLE